MPPTGLTAQAGDRSVLLTWKPDETGTRERILVFQGRDPETLALRDEIGAAETSYQATDLENGVPYHFALVAVDPDGRRSEPSAVVSAVPQAAAARAPPADLFVFPGDGEILVQWIPPVEGGEQPVGYLLFWGTAPDELTESASVPEDATEYSITDLQNDQPYFLTALAVYQGDRQSARLPVRIARPRAPDTTPPMILSAEPDDASPMVHVQAPLVVTFSEPMDPTTVVISTDPPSRLGPIQWSGNFTRASLDPESEWAQDTDYSVHVDGSDSRGNPLSGTVRYAFHTGFRLAHPQVIQVSPSVDATNVPINGRIVATFSEPMQEVSTMRALSIEPSVSLSADVDETGTHFSWTPSSDLAPNTTYHVSISQSARSLRNGPLAAKLQFDFTTGTAADHTAPRVLDWTPEDGAVGQSRDFEIVIRFSEPMDPRYTAQALVFPDLGSVKGLHSWEANGTVLRFKARVELGDREWVSWRVTGLARDLAGNSIESEVSSGFQTLHERRLYFSAYPQFSGLVIAWPDQTFDATPFGENTPWFFFGTGKPSHNGEKVAAPIRSFVSIPFHLPDDLIGVRSAVLLMPLEHMGPDCSAIGSLFFEKVSFGHVGGDLFFKEVDSVPFCTPQGQCQDEPYWIEAECAMGAPGYYAGVTRAVLKQWDDRQGVWAWFQLRMRTEREGMNFERAGVWATFRPYSFSRTIYPTLEILIEEP